MALHTSSVALDRAGAGAASPGAGTLRRLWPAALAGALALLACSSSSPNPPQLPGCVPTKDVSCGGPVAGGGTTPPSDGGAVAIDSGTEVGEGGTCAGATQIFPTATSAASCATCVAANCCSSATSCPNDPSCVSLALCVTSQCLPNDQSCLPTCEAGAMTGTITEYIDFQQCVGQSCPGCPALGSGDL